MRNMLALLLLSLAVTACGDSVGPDPDAHVGTYTLQTVNGSPLPFLIRQEGNNRIELTEGTVTLNANGTFSSRHSHRFTEGESISTETQSLTGTYVKSDGTFTFTDNEGDVYSALLEGNSLTLNEGGVVAVYRK